MNADLPNTNDLGELRLRLRDDLEFVMREYAGCRCFVVEDRTNSRFYQIGVAEYTLISLLDGSTTLADAIRLTSSRLGADAFAQQSAASIVKWLLDSQLVSTPEGAQTTKLLEKSSSEQRRKWATRLNPILVKISICNPDRLLNLLIPWFGWIPSRAAVVGWLILCGLAVGQLLAKGDEVFAAASGVVDRNNWLWLAATWLGLRFFHELGHALACRRFGGQVKDCGVMLILMMPIPYVDVTSSWRFGSKWQRIATSAAGMYVELALAAAATLAWSYSDNALVQHHAYNIMLLGSVTTLMFNVNFLMRFDGYYMLSDCLEIPNLYSLGQQDASYLGKRYLLGVQLQAPREQHRKIIRGYGIAALIWRVFVCACLIISAEALFFGFGLILSVLGLVIWLCVPAYRFATYLLDRENTQPISSRHAALTFAGLISMLVAAFTVIPWPGRESAPAVVEYESATHVRTEVAGLVAAVHVQEGEQVERGQLLLELKNDDLRSKLAELEIFYQQARLRARQYILREELAALLAERAELESLEQKLADLRHQVASLRVTAPQDGMVIARDLPSLVDQYLDSRTEILTIADPRRVKLTLLIHQDDIGAFQSQLGKSVTVFLASAACVDGLLDELAPQASDEVSSAALIAPAGGPIAVRQASEFDSSEWRSIHPRFAGTVILSPAEAHQVHAGQTAQVTLSSYAGTLGGEFCRRIRNWARDQLTDHRACARLARKPGLETWNR